MFGMKNDKIASLERKLFNERLKVHSLEIELDNCKMKLELEQENLSRIEQSCTVTTRTIHDALTKLTYKCANQETTIRKLDGYLLEEEAMTASLNTLLDEKGRLLDTYIEEVTILTSEKVDLQVELEKLKVKLHNYTNEGYKE